MKNLTLKFLFGVLSFSLLTAFTVHHAPTNPRAIKIALEESSNQEWGPWNQTDCYKGLDFRVKNRGKNYDGTKHKWAVQFRNRYKDKIHFSYEVYNNKPSSPRAKNRTDLDPNETSSGYRDFYMQNASSIYVYVDDVRFVKDGSQAYYNCDK